MTAFHPCRRFASEFSIAGVGPKAALRHCAEINYATNEGPPYGGASPLLNIRRMHEGMKQKA